MINHVVLLKFKADVSDADIEDLEKSLDDLPNRIHEIHTYEFGKDVVRSPRSYDFGLVALFANVPAVERYLEHPAHRPVAKKIQQLCERIITVDFEGSDAGSTASRPTGELNPFELV